MNDSHIPQPTEMPKVLKESKNKIRVDFERTPLWQRIKAKFFSTFFLQKVVWYVFRLILLIGISYIILFPFFAKVTGSFMYYEDFADVTVRLIPKNWTLDTYKAIILENSYLEACVNTALLSLTCALLQTLVACLVGYGLAKFRFRGSSIMMLLVVLTMIIPHRTIKLALYELFEDFYFFGNVLETDVPLTLLSLTGLAFKNGLFIFMMRQFFTGVPDELEESAYVDGSGVYRTFVQIILPLSIPMMITIFVLSFSWQWTDEFYTSLFNDITFGERILMPKIITVPQSLTSLKATFPAYSMFESAVINTTHILIMLPLVVIYLFCQKYLIQGIERSGIVG
ncbi:MAG: carbohydrate ABC transporter permease [Clostridia bacterium]|nr:carbohydrate ABC transporter permease [Clostridia bacterium]